MNNQFNTVMLPHLSTNRFDLSHEIKTTFKMGQLIPTFVLDVLPGGFPLS